MMGTGTLPRSKLGDEIEAVQPRHVLIDKGDSGSRTNRAPATAHLRMADTGCGIAPEMTSQLFQPFVTTKRHGMGVGLSISRTIIEGHGGRIWADANPGGGTVFRFTLRGVDKEDIGDAV
jgi:two-component system sensor kinase FixL